MKMHAHKEKYEHGMDKPHQPSHKRATRHEGVELYGDAMEQAYGAAGPEGRKSDESLVSRRMFHSYADHQ